MALFVNGLFPGIIVPDTTVAGCIDIFENVWPGAAATIESLEHECSNPDSGAYWQRAETVGDGINQQVRTNKVLHITYLANVANNPLLQNIHNQFNIILLATTIEYAQRYNIRDRLYHEEYSLLKYEEGQEYKAHFDDGPTTNRIISAILYLNDDFEGGEIEFIHMGIKIKPQAGMLIVFPSSYPYTHVAHPVTKGKKYALVTWIKDSTK
jgi:predicted 2-oxoglutarate/Fe(II)-dependent dioxygenase YbiX